MNGLASLITAILGILPQSVLVFYAGLGLVGSRNRLRRLILPALILGVIVAVIRAAPGLLGWHVPIFFGLYLLFARLFRLGSFISALAADALSFVLTALADVLLIVPALEIFSLSHVQIWNDPVLRILFAWLESGFLLIGALLVKWKGFVLIPVTQNDVPSHRREVGR